MLISAEMVSNDCNAKYHAEDALNGSCVQVALLCQGVT